MFNPSIATVENELREAITKLTQIEKDSHLAASDRRLLISAQASSPLKLQIYKNTEILLRHGRSINQILSPVTDDSVAEINEGVLNCLYCDYGVYKILTQFRSPELFHRILSSNHFVNLPHDDDNDYKWIVATTIVYPLEEHGHNYTRESMQRVHPDILLSVVKNFATFEPMIKQMNEMVTTYPVSGKKWSYLTSFRQISECLHPFFMANKALDFVHLAKVIITENRDTYTLIPYLLHKISQDPECTLDVDDKIKINEITDELMDSPNLVYDQMPLSVLQKWLTLDALIGSNLPMNMKVDMVRENLAAIHSHRHCLAELLAMPDEIMTRSINYYFNTLVNLQCELLSLPFQPRDISINFPIMNYVLKESPRFEQFCQAQYNDVDLAPAAQSSKRTKYGNS